MKSRMKLLLAEVFVVSLLLTSPTFATYANTYTFGVTDFTPYAAKTNLWLALPGGGDCEQQSVSVGYDGFIWCVGTDQHDYAWSPDTRTWAQHPEMGTSATVMVARDSKLVWALIPSSSCANGNLGAYKWSGTKWTQPSAAANLCFVQLQIADDGSIWGIVGEPGTQIQTGIVAPPSNNQLHYSTDGGVTWTLFGKNWIYVNMWSQNSGCAIQGNTGGMFQISSNPNVPPIAVTPPGTPTNPIPPHFSHCVRQQADPIMMGLDDNGIVWLLSNDGKDTW